MLVNHARNSNSNVMNIDINRNAGLVVASGSTRGVRYRVCGVRCMVKIIKGNGFWFMVSGLWSMVYGLWSMVYGA